MSLTFTALLRQWVTPWLVCLLSACLPLQGMALVSERIQGAAHVHVDPTAAEAAAALAAPSSTSVRPRPADSSATFPMVSQVTAWPPGMPMLLDVTGLRHSHGASRQPAPASAELANVQHHDHVAHHLHDPADTTVLSLDEAPSPTDAAAGGASKRVMLDVDGPPAHALRQAGASTRPPQMRPEVTAWAQVPGDRLERPPRSTQR